MPNRAYRRKYKNRPIPVIRQHPELAEIDENTMKLDREYFESHPGETEYKRFPTEYEILTAKSQGMPSDINIVKVIEVSPGVRMRAFGYVR